MKELKQLVEDIIEYTKTWSITESEWYYIKCIKDPEITWEEFEMVIREEILYDLVYNNGNILYEQMKVDLSGYETDNVSFQNASKELERKVQEYFKDFKLHR